MEQDPARHTPRSAWARYSSPNRSMVVSIGRGARDSRRQRAVSAIFADSSRRSTRSSGRGGGEDPIQALDQATGADPAGNGLAARLAGGEVEQESRRGDHARRRVGDEHRSDPTMCPRRLASVVRVPAVSSAARAPAPGPPMKAALTVPVDPPPGRRSCRSTSRAPLRPRQASPPPRNRDSLVPGDESGPTLANSAAERPRSRPRGPGSPRCGRRSAHPTGRARPGRAGE